MAWALTNAVYFGMVWLGFKLVGVSLTFLFGFLDVKLYNEGAETARKHGHKVVWSRGGILLWAWIFWLLAMLDFTLVYRYFEVSLK
jgi:hypothetical protein